MLKYYQRYPVLCNLLAKDGSTNHCVTIVDNFIFDSNRQHAMTLNKQNLDWCCNGLFESMYNATVFMPLNFFNGVQVKQQSDTRKFYNNDVCGTLSKFFDLVYEKDIATIFHNHGFTERGNRFSKMVDIFKSNSFFKLRETQKFKEVIMEVLKRGHLQIKVYHNHDNEFVFLQFLDIIITLNITKTELLCNFNYDAYQKYELLTGRHVDINPCGKLSKKEEKTIRNNNYHQRILYQEPLLRAQKEKEERLDNILNCVDTLNL